MKWAQELLWIKRDERGQIVGISEKPPADEDFIPSMPAREEEEPID